VEPDLTYSDLRAVSPVHLQYLANMGVGASLSFSIRVGGLLWGLVACHHERPRQLPLRVREHCVELAHTFALGVGSYQANRRLGRLGNADAWVERVAELARDVELGRRLPALLDPVLLEPLGATGAALVWDGGLRTFGVAPPREAIAAIDGWLRSAERGPVLATDRLAAESGLDLGQDQVAGLLAVQSGLAGELGERRFYWFRPEQPRTLSWAGDPAKPVDAGSGGLGVGPRRSFELWVETTRGHSAPWDELDLVLARKLRILLLRDFRVGGPESG
jgi:light-regulated signal transduction histidine kinase (bacteriophytochrome)